MIRASEAAELWALNVFPIFLYAHSGEEKAAGSRALAEGVSWEGQQLTELPKQFLDRYLIF